MTRAQLLDEIRRLKEFIEASKECAEAFALVELQEHYDDLFKRCRDAMDQITKGLACKVGHCCWCGETWPNPQEDGAFEAIRRIASAHDNACAKNPLRMERDHLRRQLDAVRAAIAKETPSVLDEMMTSLASKPDAVKPADEIPRWTVSALCEREEQ